LQAVLPYFAFTWLLLSVILFVQQASRFSELLFNTALPNYLIWQLTVALIPNVIAFTCPIAVLVGVIIGLSRMQGDSEMVSLRAAGVGNVQIAMPLILLGIALSGFAFLVNLKGVPLAAQIVRQVALKAALYKLESPIEPGVFNTEIDDLTIFVKKGDIENGSWEDLFVFQEDKVNRVLRLITAKKGRIDTSNDETEIVLRNALVSTLQTNDEDKLVSEKVEELRLVVKTKRGEIIEKLSKTKETPEEMGLVELAAHIKTLKGRERTEAEILWQRRLVLSITPLMFALLGAALVTKFSRGGRGFGVFLSLASLVAYYLITLLGEQLARNGTINVLTAGLVPIGSSIVVISWLFISKRFFITKSLSIKSLFTGRTRQVEGNSGRVTQKSSLIDMTTGILDFDLVWSLVKYYALTFAFLTTIYVIFTAFELWKFAGTMDNGITLLIKYLFFLIPFIYIQLSPSALMIATLATYVIKSRQNEIVTWTAAGQSVYRLLLPCFVFMIGIGILNFGLQEWFITEANRVQDSIRDQIRSRGVVSNKNGKKVWISNGNKIFTFNSYNASDNAEMSVSNLKVFEFDEGMRLTSMIRSSKAVWNRESITLLANALETVWVNDKIETRDYNERIVNAKFDPFEENVIKPSHLNISETKRKIAKSDSLSEKRTYQISLHKKYSTPLLPFIIILFTAPFALTLGRKGNVITIGYAIAVWLMFMGVINIFEQFGQSGYLSPRFAIWSPLVLFTIVGMYLLTRVKT